MAIKENTLPIGSSSGTGTYIRTVSSGGESQRTPFDTVKGAVTADIDDALDTKVDKVTGKGLSTNDFTTAEKNKLAGIQAGAQVNTIETVKVNGTALVPDANKAVNVPAPTVDAALSESSTNPVQNKVITGAVLDLKEDLSNFESNIRQIFLLSEWRAGYYKSDGSFDTWTRAICTTGKYTIDENTLYITAKAPTGRYIKISEYDSNDNFIKDHGDFRTDSQSTGETNIVEAHIPAGNKIALTVGFFDSGTSSQYLTQEFIDSIRLEYTYPKTQAFEVEFGGLDLWKTGYVNVDTGAVETWNQGIIRDGFIACDDAVILYVKSITDYGVRVFEYTKEGVYKNKYYGTADTVARGGTNEIMVHVEQGSLFRILIGRFWNRDAENYITDQNMNDIDIIFYRTTQGNTLTPTGDDSDRKSEIEAMLATFGCCELLGGDYYTTGITMPKKSTLKGCGVGSRLVLDDSVESGSAVYMDSLCSVENLEIVGALTPIELSEVVGTRHGISWVGVGSTTIKEKGFINDIYAHDFTGGGITLNETGYSASGGLCISNCYVQNCNVGLNIARLSEFHKISNCDFVKNYYGVVNNGGNNSLSNCNISTNVFGIFMDNSSGTMNNNSHGNAVGCILQHNTINAIYINNMVSGFDFTGCNIDNGGVDLIAASRILFVACNFMASFSINIVDGGLILFSSCNMRDYTEPHTIISNNNAVKFVNCYLSNGTEVDPTN